MHGMSRDDDSLLCTWEIPERRKEKGKRRTACSIKVAASHGEFSWKLAKTSATHEIEVIQNCSDVHHGRVVSENHWQANISEGRGPAKLITKYVSTGQVQPSLPIKEGREGHVTSFPLIYKPQPPLFLLLILPFLLQTIIEKGFKSPPLDIGPNTILATPF